MKEGTRHEDVSKEVLNNDKLLNSSWQLPNLKSIQLLYLDVLTLPETNELLLKIGRAPKGNSSSNHPFSGVNFPSRMINSTQPTVSFLSQKTDLTVSHHGPRFFGWKFAKHLQVVGRTIHDDWRQVLVQVSQDLRE